MILTGGGSAVFWSCSRPVAGRPTMVLLHGNLDVTVIEAETTRVSHHKHNVGRMLPQCLCCRADPYEEDGGYFLSAYAGTRLHLRYPCSWVILEKHVYNAMPSQAQFQDAAMWSAAWCVYPCILCLSTRRWNVICTSSCWSRGAGFGTGPAHISRESWLDFC